MLTTVLIFLLVTEFEMVLFDSIKDKKKLSDEFVW